MILYKRVKINIIFVSLLFVCITNWVRSGDTISSVKYDGQDKIVLDQNTFFYWENSEEIPITISPESLSKIQYEKLPGKVPNFGFIKNDIWFTFKIENKTGKKADLVLSLSNPNLDQAELIYFDQSGKAFKLLQGDIFNYSKRTIDTKKITFPLILNPNEARTYYLRINNGGEQFHFAPVIQKKDMFLQHESEENYFLGIFFGILVFVLLFNIFMWVITKEAISRQYSLYLLTFLFLQLSLLGFGKHYLWQDNSYLSNHANPFFASISVYFLLRFSCLYLNLSTLLPRINKVFLFLQYLMLGCSVLALIPLKETYTLSILLVNGLTFLLNIIILPVSIQVIRKGYKQGILFLIAFFLLVVSVFAFVLKNFGVLPSNFFTDFGFQFGSAAEVILFSLGIVIRFRNFREEAIGRLKEINELKDKANIQLEQKVHERTLEISEQKKEIEYKNKEIISSISYAKRIQEAILPTEEKLKHLLPNSALWYSPKDIVAGDFYWTEQKHFKGKDYTFFAVGDCTGHGVPGAMMSVLCTNSLNTALDQIEGPHVSQILEICSSILVENLSQHSKEINDGMDISIACYEPESGQLFWSGANNPLWLLRKNELIEYNGTKRPIGKSSTETAFEEHVIQLESEDRLFLFSDGIVDQFGGEDQKKFKKSKLRETIIQSAELPLTEQMNFIRKVHHEWKKESEQIDDIALLITSY